MQIKNCNNHLKKAAHRYKHNILYHSILQPINTDKISIAE